MCVCGVCVLFIDIFIYFPSLRAYLHFTHIVHLQGEYNSDFHTHLPIKL